MPVIRQSYEVYAPPARIAELFDNAQNAVTIVPHLVDASITDSSFVTVWEGKLGPIKKRFTLNGRITEQSLGHFGFVGDGEGLKVRGTAEYTAINPEKTLLTVEVEIDPGRGIIAGIVDHIIANEKDENLSYVRRKLAENLKARVEPVTAAS
jgi:carbon monoxide dehydrogenase subunit G